MDQSFALRSVLGKCYDYNITLHQLFIDFKQAYHSINREKLMLILEEFKIPRKLINLIVLYTGVFTYILRGNLM